MKLYRLFGGKKKKTFLLKLNELSFHVFQDEENQQEEEAEEIASEEQVDGVTRPSLSQEVVMEEGVEEDKEERAVEMEEMLETSEEEPDDGEADTGMSKGREEEDEEETMEIIPDPQDEKVQRASPVQEEGEGMGEDEHFQNTIQTNDGVVTEIQDQVLEEVQEEQENSNQNLEDKREGDEEESGELMEQEEEEEKDEEEEEKEEEKEPTQDDQAGEEQESDEMSQLRHDPAAESTPPPLSLPEPQSNTDSNEVLLSASCKSTNLHINLRSPSSEELPSLSHLPPAAADHSQNVPETASPGGESSAEATKDEEQKESQQEHNDSSPASVTHPADRSKVRFTIAPARQRPQSSAGLITLSSPVSGPGGLEAEQETKAEAVSLSERVTEPGNGRNPVSPVVKPAQTSAAARRAGEDTNISCLLRGGKASNWKPFLTCSSNLYTQCAGTPALT